MTESNGDQLTRWRGAQTSEAEGERISERESKEHPPVYSFLWPLFERPISLAPHVARFCGLPTHVTRRCA